MTGPEGNISEFCFPETHNRLPEANLRGTLRSKGNKTHCFPWASPKEFCNTSQLKNSKKRKTPANFHIFIIFIFSSVSCLIFTRHTMKAQEKGHFSLSVTGIKACEICSEKQISFTNLYLAVVLFDI